MRASSQSALRRKLPIVTLAPYAYERRIRKTSRRAKARRAIELAEGALSRHTVSRHVASQARRTLDPDSLTSAALGRHELVSPILLFFFHIGN